MISLNDREELRNKFSERTKKFTFIFNIGATLTSLATVYVFFIGTSKLFGYFIFITIGSIAIAPWIAAKLTKLVAANPIAIARLQIASPSAAILPSLIWSNENNSHSRIIKWVQIIALMSIVWLEVTVFSKILVHSLNLGSGNVVNEAIIIAVTSFIITDFVFRYGLRGFAISDLICYPLIILGTFCLILTVFLSLGSAPVSASLVFPEPILPIANCIVFAIATCFLNAFIIVSQ